MNRNKEDLRARTRQFALRIIRLYVALPKTGPATVLGKQVLRSGTSVGAHYAEACRAKSRPDFINKIEGAMQELEETLYWMDLLAEANLIKTARLTNLQKEASELMAILITMAKRTKEHLA
jgi:four helix bundle protein